MSNALRPTIAILGGTGNLGLGLAGRWIAAGYPVILGSRGRDKAEAAARELSAARPGGSVSGDDNLSAARHAAVIVVAVPYDSHAAILSEIKDAAAGKIVIDAVVPLQPPKVSVVHVPPEGSAAQAAQAVLGPEAKVVAAFHNVSAAKLAGDKPIDCDVLVAGDDKDARALAIELSAAAGLRGIDAGALANAVAVEALTAVLIGINRRNKVTGAGIRITGLPQAPVE
jgi:NADPH-dependent F420 reductase